MSTNHAADPTTNTYDLAGRLTSTTNAGPNGATATTNYGYDLAGNQTSVQSPLGYTTTYDHDAANRLIAVTQPVTASTSITTTYGYDANGNVTRLTDGRGNLTTISYNYWNQPETRTEPDTSGQTGNTYTTIPDTGGLPLETRQPGGVTITRTFDELGRLRTETGAGSGVTSATRTYGYDLAGRRTSASHPGGTITFGYDDRGFLASTSGQAGSSTFSYDDAGRITTRADAAGTAYFTWNDRNELLTEQDALTGANGKRTNTWNTVGELTGVTYGTGATPPTRTLTYDGLGRLTGDALTVASTPAYNTTYGYDADSNLTSQTIGPAGVAGAGQHTYTYDRAGRITNWTKPDQTSVAYGWDNASNRTQAGSTTFTYDARNRLTGDSTGKTWAWSARGTLTSETTSQGTTNYTYDGLDRLLQSGSTTYTYDSLDRVASRNGGTTWSYAGGELDPVSDGTWKYARSPSGDVLALDDPATTSDPARVVGRNRHGDTVALFDTTGTVTDTIAYSPFGEEIADAGNLEPTIGYQSDYTEPTSGDVWMGARWYGPDVDTFLSRDTIGDQLRTPISLNRYTYAHGNPLAYFDPDGHAARPLIPRPQPKYVPVFGKPNVRVKPGNNKGIMVIQTSPGRYYAVILGPTRAKGFVGGSTKPKTIGLVPTLQTKGGKLTLGPPVVKQGSQAKSAVKGFTSGKAKFNGVTTTFTEGHVQYKKGNILTQASHEQGACNGAKKDQLAKLVCKNLGTYVDNEVQEHKGCGFAGLGCVSLGTLLDVVGLIPGIGDMVDITRGLVALAKGDAGGAAMYLGAAIPVVGGAVVAKKAANAIDGALDARRTAKVADEVPSVVFSRSRAPGIAKNFDDAVANGAPTRLTRASAAAKDANRRAALGGQPRPPAGQSLDEYPFACSAQGGCGSFVRSVPVAEQSYQGGVLSRFFQNSGVSPGDAFDVTFGP